MGLTSIALPRAPVTPCIRRCIDVDTSCMLPAVLIPLRRKSQQIQAQLQELGEEALEERMQSGVAMLTNPPYRLSTLIAELSPQV